MKGITLFFFLLISITYIETKLSNNMKRDPSIIFQSDLNRTEAHLIESKILFRKFQMNQKLNQPFVLLK